MSQQPIQVGPARIDAWFDGCCEPHNPGGHAAYGALVKVDGEIVFSEGRYIGSGSEISNNVAEYQGVIAVLEQITGLHGQAVVRGDSQLVINQLKRKWKARKGLYLPSYEKAIVLADSLRSRVRFEWIPREQNNECDQLSKKPLLDRNIQFRLQPCQDMPMTYSRVSDAADENWF
jgi:ribonuclease HI